MSPDAYLEMAETQHHHWWFCGRRQILTRILRGLALPQNARILEVGSGTGGNLEMLASFGQVSAIEMDDVARDLTKRNTRVGVDLRAGRCPDDIPFTDERFDLICLFDVLEHIPDDAATLSALHGLLTQNGRLLLTVPAYRWLWGAHDTFLHHQRRYNASELRSKLHVAGFHVQRLSFFNTLLFPLAALVRLKERLHGSSHAAGGAVPSEPLNSLLLRVFALEKHWLHRFNFPFGVSLLVVAAPVRRP